MSNDEKPIPWPNGSGEMADRIRAFDWASTPLGPVETWPQSLKTVVDMLLVGGFPAVALWGPDLIQIYNDGYRIIMADKHPTGLGQPTRECWPEIWHINEPIYERVYAGETLAFEDKLFPVTRHGPLENACFTLCPLRGESGGIAGVLVTVSELSAFQRARAEAALRDSEERQAFLLALGDAMRAQSSANATIEVAARMLGERLNASRILFAEFDEARGIVDIFHGWFADGAKPFPTVMRLEDYEGPIMHDLRAGRTVRIEDAGPPFAQPDLASIAELGVKALLSVPLVIGGRLKVNLSVHQDAARRWTDEEVSLLQEVAGRLWADLVRARTEEALRASEEKYRNLFETMGQGYAEIELLRDEQGRAVDQRYIEFNPAFERLIGIPVIQAKGRNASEVLPELEPWWHETFAGIAQRGEPERVEYQVASLGRWYEVYAYPRGGDRLTVLYQDITERARNQAALHESEQRFRQFGEASSDVLWIRDAENLQWEYLSDAFKVVYGQERDEALSANTLRNWLDLILPEDREHALDNIRRVRGGERVTFEYRIRRPVDGEVRWLRNTDFPIFDADGHIRSIGGIGHDGTEEKEAADRLQVLVAELQHRTRNLVAVVRGLADRTLKESSSLEDFQVRYGDRLKAIARVQGLLSRLGEGRRIPFDELLRTELSALGAFEGMAERVTLDGPEGVRLRSGMVQTFALALHELATNAVKYGALSPAGGRLEIRWRVETDDAGSRLHVEWRESDVVMAATSVPQQGGYGRELIERALPYQLKAKTTYEIGPDGVRCTIAVPIPTDQAQENHDG